MKTDVLIVGAGPTGLMAANQCLRFGIDFIILDVKDGPTKESRAIVVTARSLEIYQQMNLSETVLINGEKVQTIKIKSGGQKKAELFLGALGEGQSDFKYMFAYEQSKNESLLYKNLLVQHKDVMWNTEFLSFEHLNDGVMAKVVTKNTEININSKYLVACDGASSRVRKQLDIPFSGGTYEHKFFVADAKIKWNGDYKSMVAFPGMKNFCAFIPMKGEQNYRIIGTLPRSISIHDEINFEHIKESITSFLTEEIEFEKTNWFSVYKLHHRSVNEFRHGNIFLAGDSAHIHSPAGGQGMNTGLQDAYNLIWKISLVLIGRCSDSILNTYNEERLPFARWLLKFTDKAFNLMTSDNWIIARYRKFFVLNVAGHLLKRNFIRKKIFKTASQTGYSYKNQSLSSHKSKQKLKFKAGDRIPYIQQGYYKKFQKSCFHLIIISDHPFSETRIKQIKNLFPIDLEIIEGSLKTWQQWGVEKELYVLIRPDNYIAIISDEINEELLTDFRKKYFILNK